ncbi:hypothetical protein CPB83DRAFT_910652 [Crepidotus variabilis]|uniref:3-keto sterol reductase n=1 Tax=Crepidotus variabilis TaxID=179855 RepID=A0A9P6E6E4_9AGAR|nr:hypothetical protein CPB83DRAFT_910652 [Crepidotus variabilis]
MSRSAHPIIIVTGANGGVGTGICQRLLSQLCQKNPSDSHPLSSTTFQDQTPENVVYEGVTLIMACRNKRRGETARSELLKWFDRHLKGLEKQAFEKHVDGAKEVERIRQFKTHCRVEVAELDLASFASVLKCASGIREKVPYISHLVLNAGVASFKGLDWILIFKQLWENPLGLVTEPTFYTQHCGEKSPDNLGWVWQSNVFGHFALVRELEPLLLKAPLDGARVIWSSSLEASPKFYDSEDWQLVKTEHSYESVKYQIDLISATLDEDARNSPLHNPTRHFVSEPGVCSTNISSALVTPFLEMLKVILFYIYRIFGRQHLSIVPFKAAVAAAHLVLAPLAFIPLFLANDPDRRVRYGATSDRWGHERVILTPIKEWKTYKDEGRSLVKKCDKLYKELRAAELAAPVFEIASEKI